MKKTNQTKTLSYFLCAIFGIMMFAGFASASNYISPTSSILTGSWNFTNNIYSNSGIFYGNASASWFNGLFNWTTGDIYNSFNGHTLNFNETKLNATIEALDTDTTYTAGSNLTLTGTTFAVNMTAAKDYFDNNYVELSGDTMTGNLTLGQKITFILGETIDNIADGIIAITGKLSITDDLIVNVNKFFVNATSGKVGIGTISPDYDLEVYSSPTSSLKITGATDAAQLILSSDDSGEMKIKSGNNLNDLQFLVSNSGATIDMIIDSTGKIGIGTTTPQNKLNIIGDGNFTTDLIVGGNLTTEENIIINQDKKICFDGNSCNVYQYYNGSALITKVN